MDVEYDFTDFTFRSRPKSREVRRRFEVEGECGNDDEVELLARERRSLDDLCCL